MMTTAQIQQLQHLQHTTLSSNSAMKLKTLHRSRTFCTRTNPTNHRHSSSSSDAADDGEVEEDVSSTEEDNNNNNITACVSMGRDNGEVVERVLPNGDIYTGGFIGNVPDGNGKYLWCDGCMYTGEWRKGKAYGKGRFSWPSGATYEGELKAGRMHGYGTYIGIESDMYKGMWVGDKKEGKGEKVYANGDVYVGEWRGNVQCGKGKYVWRNGNVYVGEWKDGVIYGKGVLIWDNGNKYQGFWVNGMPNGAGVFTRPDGTTYAGNWGGEGDGGGGGGDGSGRKSSEERGVNFPRICIWDADEEAGEITCDIVGNVEVNKLYKKGSQKALGENGGGGVRNKSSSYGSLGRRSPSPSPSESHNVSPRPYWYGGGDEVKKPGQPISRGHKNYDLMLNLQLGVRHSVGKHAMKNRDLKASDFEPKEKFWTRFPPEGSKHTPPHQSVDFRWKDYCPMVFRHLREHFGIDPAQYMLAICGTDALIEFSSPGKSGCCFYLTQDDRYMIKTVKKAEVKVLIKMLPKYYEHVSKYHNTLVTKFFGVHCVKPVGGQKTRFIVMGNLFHSEYRIHKRFDLKGSSHGRSIDKPEGEIDETTTLKDLDLKFVFRVQQSWFQELMRQVDRDCEFLEAEKIMDYSLLIGLHFRDDSPNNERAISPPGNATQQVKSPSQGYEMFTSQMEDTNWIMEGKRPFIRLGANMPARAERVLGIETESQSGSGTPRSVVLGNGEVYEVILYFGIIDILQDYDISKKLEHAYKSLQADSSSISAVDPKLYSKRFRDFMHRVFMEDE